MKKNKWLFMLILGPILTFGQDIKANEKKFTTLLFESNIVSGIIGNEDFIFEYNLEEPDNIALIKALNKNASDTSLVIKTENGTIFNLNVIYGTENKNIVRISDTLGVTMKQKKNNVTGKNPSK